jgi:predicted RNA-binding protein YlxR (DUF448 family)
MDKSERLEGAGRIRRCAATYETLPEARLMRFVADRDGVIFPDPAARAPGRGVWVTATRDAVDLAVKKNAFSRGLKRETKVQQGLSDMVASALRQRCLDIISLAKKAGGVIIGNDQVASFLRSQRPAWRIEASDGSPDGRSKLNGLSLVWGGVPTAGCFTGAEIGMALGRDVVIHALLTPCRLADSWTTDIRRLGGFIALVPDDWPKDMSDDVTLNVNADWSDDEQEDDQRDRDDWGHAGS